MHVPAPTLLFLMKLRNGLTCTRLWCRAPGHPAPFKLRGVEDGQAGVPLVCGFHAAVVVSAGSRGDCQSSPS